MISLLQAKLFVFGRMRLAELQLGESQHLPADIREVIRVHQFHDLLVVVAESANL